MRRSRTTSPKARRPSTPPFPLLDAFEVVGARRMAVPDPTDGVGRRGSTDERIGQAEGLALGARRARADGGRSGTPERAGTHGLANDAPVVREAPEKKLGDLDVRNRIGPVGEQERDLGGRETVLEVLEQRLGRLRGRRSLQ